jgi:PAS domain S-box-containing protein
MDRHSALPAAPPVTGGVATRNDRLGWRLIESLSEHALFLLDASGTVLSWTKTAERIYGWSASQIIGNHYASFFTSEDVAAGLPDFQLDMTSRAGRFATQSWRIRQDGTTFLAEIVITALFDRDGQTTGFVKVTRDISERAETEATLRKVNTELEARLTVGIDAEAALQRANTDLELKVAERTAELRVAIAELESFTYSVAHDLRAPLRTMQSFSEALLQDFGDHLDGKLRDYLGRIERGSRRMARLIDDLLRLAQVSRASIDRRNICLSDLANQILDELRRAEPDRDVETNVQPGIWAGGDPALLRVAFENLLGNAWKFTAKTPSARVGFGLVQHAGREVAFVQDNGAGFDMAYSHKLFVPFQRLHSGQEFDGTGIGLVTVSRILRRHDGDISLESQIDGGTTAFITLPQLRQSR